LNFENNIITLHFLDANPESHREERREMFKRNGAQRHGVCRSIIASTMSVEMAAVVVPTADGGPMANRFTLYRSHRQAANLMHNKDTAVAVPSTPMVMLNTVPSSP
jgi:hypothetical protein